MSVETEISNLELPDKERFAATLDEWIAARRTESFLELLDKEGCAAKLDISPSTLDLWVRERRIPFFKIGGIIRFSWPRVRQALDKFEVKEASHAERPS